MSGGGGLFVVFINDMTIEHTFLSTPTWGGMERCQIKPIFFCGIKRTSRSRGPWENERVLFSPTCRRKKIKQAYRPARTNQNT